MANDPYKYFRLEARELIEQLGSGVLALEKDGGVAVVQRLLRQAHTLKGAARVVRQPEIAEHAHAIEDALVPFREQATNVPRNATTALLGLIDAIASRVAALDAPEAPSAPTEAAPPAPSAIRAELGDMDALLDGIIETHTGLSALRGMSADLERARQLADVLAAQLTPRSQRAPASRDADKARGLAETLRALIAGCERKLDSGLDHVTRELGQVRDAAEQLRLVPADSVFTALERTVRDAAHEVGKQVELATRGGDVRLDAHVLAVVQGALVQLARNAVAHGIEPAATRIAAGKAPSGHVTIEVSRRGRRVVFSCRDDGSGVDLEAVRRVAQRRGVAVGNHDAAELVGMLLRGGITTSARVTEVAGRGVGLDVVREAIDRLGGEVTVATDPRGTTFELVLPVTLTSIEALLVESSGVVAAIPIEAVRHTRRITLPEVSRTARGEAIVDQGELVPFVRLATALRADEARHRTAWLALVIAGTSGAAVIGVDRMLGTATVIVRPIPELAAIDPIVAGAALDAEGNPQLVLDPASVIAVARSQRSVAEQPLQSRRSVLVIDDSLTTRMLEQSILESAGYDVDTAVSGEQALEAARRKRYALFLVDVEMPGIDGFTFIERVRADPDLAGIPSILVTSRATPADLRRGQEVGARGYIVKSEFDQTDLLARIERMVR
jgi:two-component system, chemotaxis family, sensor kinase CheA